MSKKSRPAVAMKALSLTQPWASLVECRAKSLETRTWWTGYRGPLVIHAAKAYPAWANELARTDVFRKGLGGLDPDKLPLGVGLCVVNLLACVQTQMIYKLAMMGMKPSASEIPFGNFEDGRWVWVLEHQYSFAEPIPSKGGQRVWTWPHEVYQMPAPDADIACSVCGAFCGVKLSKAGALLCPGCDQHLSQGVA